MINSYSDRLTKLYKVKYLFSIKKSENIKKQKIYEALIIMKEIPDVIKQNMYLKEKSYFAMFENCILFYFYNIIKTKLNQNT